MNTQWRVLTAAVTLTLGLAVNLFAQERDTLRVAFRAPVSGATTAEISLTSDGNGCTGFQGNVQTTTTQSCSGWGPSQTCHDIYRFIDTLTASAPIVSQGVSSVLRGRNVSGAAHIVKYGRGSVSLNLDASRFKDAEVSLFSVNGKRVLRGKASASKGAFEMSSKSLAPGAYLISVKGVGGNTFASKIIHGGGKLSVNAAFGGANTAPAEFASVSGCGNWTLTIKADGYDTYTHQVFMTNANNDGIVVLPEIKLIPSAASVTDRPPTKGQDFIEEIDGQSIKMVYIPGGTFDLGCEGSGCPANTGMVKDVKVSSFWMADVTVGTTLYNAVMGIASSGGMSFSMGNYDWYGAHKFACVLSRKTGRNYRMMTEAEFEYAAKKHTDKINWLTAPAWGGSPSHQEEWAYNTWSQTHDRNTQDPIGGSKVHDQKTRRNTAGTGTIEDAWKMGRLIRSIEGMGPLLRLVISADMDYPPGMHPPCELNPPDFKEPENSYRDPRWVTDGDAAWNLGYGGNISFWADGTATSPSMVTIDGQYTMIRNATSQWFTANNLILVIVTKGQTGFGSSGSDITAVTYYPYIFLDDTQGSTIPGGRYEKSALTTPVVKPTIADLKSGRVLAEEYSNNTYDFRMIDMANIPEKYKKQDPRLLDGLDSAWLQDNRTIGATHHYRKDVDPDEFRFTVGNMILANGSWFTIGGYFLRVRHPDGYQTDYVYAISSSGAMGGVCDNSGTAFFHNSFQAYERGDFRSFQKVSNSSCNFPTSQVAQEIPKGQSQSSYATASNGYSTFVPAPCPAGGCEQYSW